MAEAWATLRVVLREAGRSMPLNDSWIAATAITLGIPVVAQDDHYFEIGALRVINVSRSMLGPLAFCLDPTPEASLKHHRAKAENSAWQRPC